MMVMIYLYDDIALCNKSNGRCDIKAEKREDLESKVVMNQIQGVFFNWAHPKFAKCRPVSNRFQKNDRVPDWPPL